MFRDEILIRPPVEASSVLIGVTEGCAWGRCRFCGIYDGKVLVQYYRVRPWESIKADIDVARLAWATGARRAFLAGGNALSAPASLLLQVLAALKDAFPALEQVSSYAKNHDALAKSHDDLVALKDAGLDIVYMGLESGSDALLRYMRKGTTSRGMIRAAKAIKGAGIALSVYVVLGLGGKEFPDHPVETARVLTAMKPDFIRFRSLNFIPNSILFDDWQAGRFHELRPIEILQEERTIIANLGDFDTVVLNDHASNYSYTSGRLPGDKERVIRAIDMVINDPALQHRDHVNRTSM